MSNKPEYDWEGNWTGPGRGKYVISQDGEELEPGRVVELLDEYQDLLEQVKRVRFNAMTSINISKPADPGTVFIPVIVEGEMRR